MVDQIVLDKVSLSFNGRRVLHNFSANLEQGKTYVLYGPSGCGKTTLLRIIADLNKIDSGMIHGLKNKSIVYMFQEYRLLPWATVFENVSIVLTGTKTEVIEKVNNKLELVNLSDYKAYYPCELSGGMCQRLSIARTLAYLEQLQQNRLLGEILLLDEPFKGLDDTIKTKLVNYIKSNRHPRQTIILVTHDYLEAKTLGDEIIYMEKDKLFM